jgi:squalene-associated FAD-dependent desaturase
MSSPDAVVVGGGFAGLSAAVRLAERGVRVLVLEKRSRLGGRSTAFRDRETGSYIDNGPHVLAGAYRETFAFLDTIGASRHLDRPSGLVVTLVDRRGQVSRLVCPGADPDAWVSWPSPLHLLVGVWGWRALSWRDRVSILRMAEPLRRARGAAASGGPTSERADVMDGVTNAGETVDAWLARHGQSGRVRELFWDPLALAALNQPPTVAAAAYFARVLGEMFGLDPSGAAIALPARPLDMMYAEPARTFVEARGGEVRTGADATIVMAGDGLTVRAVDSAGMFEQWRPTAVIAAVPWFALPTVFAGETAPLSPTLTAASATEASPIVTVNLWFDRPVLGDAFIGLPRRPLQWAFEQYEDARDGSFAARVSLLASGDPDLLAMTNRSLVALASEQLRDAIPASRTAALVHGGVVREPRATFSLAPGQPPRPSARTPVAGLYLAGDWIATGLPATIESAVRSGHMAADLVQRDRARK